MAISLSIFLYVYLFFVLVWLIFSFIGLHHLIRYGQIGFSSTTVTVIYVVIATWILYQTYLYLSEVDWSLNLMTIKGNLDIFGQKNY